MKYGAIVMVLVLAGCSTGCHSARARHDEVGGPERDAARSTVAQVIEVKSVELGRAYRIDKVLRLADVPGPHRTWRILVGPNPSGGAAAIRYTNTEPDVCVENGWAFVDVATTVPTPAGGSDWGVARTKRVSGTATGTQFIVQEQHGVHRVILLSGPGDVVHAVLDGNKEGKRDLTAARTFFEVGPKDETLPSPLSLDDASSDVKELVAYVERVAALGGLEPKARNTGE